MHDLKVNLRSSLQRDDIQEALKRASILLQNFSHGLAIEGGWWHDPATGEKIERNNGEMFALIHSEISEAMEGNRKDLMDDKLPHRKMEEVELADAIIRIFDYAGAKGFDIGGALVEKLIFNVTRKDHQAESRLQPNGKKY